MASREDIEAAIERLAARGVKPSVRRKIWEELGMTGSHSQINPVLSAWRIKQAGKSAAGSPVPDELTETAMSLVTRCWALAEKKALEDAQDGRRGADLRIKEIEQKNTELKETLEKSELDVGVQEHRNGILVQKLSASEQVVGENFCDKKKPITAEHRTSGTSELR